MTSKQNRTDSPEWYAQLKVDPASERCFTPERRRHVLNQARAFVEQKKKANYKPYLGLASVVILVMSLWFLVEFYKFTPTGELVATPPTDGPSLGPLQAYVGGDGVIPELVQAFVGGDGMVAGQPAGCWWNFTIPYEVLEGKALTVTATHIQSGLTQIEVPETIFAEEHIYNEYLTRVSSSMALPLAGTWLFEVKLAGEVLKTLKYGVSDDEWTLSSSFNSGSYQMIGVPYKLGFTNAELVAGKGNKYLWHFWGSEKRLTGEVKIRAVKQGETSVIDVFASDLKGGPLNGADLAIPTAMRLPELGLWKLMVHINDQWFGNVIVEVN